MYAITKKELDILLAGGCLKMKGGGWKGEVGERIHLYWKDETPCPPGRDGFIHTMEPILKEIFPALFIVDGKEYYGVIVAKQMLTPGSPWWHKFVGIRQKYPQWLYVFEGASREPQKNQWESVFSVEPGSINDL